MTLLQTYFHVPVDILHHLPFMVDLSACPSQTHSFEARQHFMTIGNFRHAPNWDAVLQLQQMWPQIRQQLPQAELHIYGSYPPPKATALHNPKTGFFIKGWVADAQLAMEQARICLAPLRFGAGIKGKLLDAMIMQTPSITTPIGSEGMHEDASWPGVIASDDYTFIQAAVSLYQDKQAWAACQQYASSLLKSKYDVARLSRDFIEKIILIRSQLEQHRRKNFIGGMMRHHSMYSTKYMSQWIEAKNK
jgi:glycosyltransferase involved in cell wall biosynthesis